MTKRDFEKCVEEAVLAIPDELRSRIGNLAVVIGDRCEAGEDCDGGYWGENELLGLFEGVALVDQIGDPSGMLPPKITLFRHSIEEEAGSEEAVPEVIRETVWHEVAHYFGFDEDGAERLERKWQKRWEEKFGKL